MPSRAISALAAVYAIATCAMGSHALSQQYCSKDNTATGESVTFIYNSLGSCNDRCVKQNAAYAVVQGQKCWCTDSTPSESAQTSLNQCDQPCPGYPSDDCGSVSGDTFGYVALVAPAGSTLYTNAPPTASATASSSASAQPYPVSSGNATSSSSGNSNTTTSSTPSPFHNSAARPILNGEVLFSGLVWTGVVGCAVSLVA